MAPLVYDSSMMRIYGMVSRQLLHPFLSWLRLPLMSLRPAPSVMALGKTTAYNLIQEVSTLGF